MGTEAVPEERPDHQHPYLQALQVAQVPVDQIISQAEAIGFPPEGLLRLAEALVGAGQGGSEMASLMLVLGVARHWQPFAVQAMGLGFKFFEPILHPSHSEFDSLAHLLKEVAWDNLCSNALERLGYPLQAGLRTSVAAAGGAFVPWLDKDLGLVLDGLELTSFVSGARVWSRVFVDSLILCDGVGPKTLNHAPRDCWSETVPAIRLHGVRRLRSLEGLRFVSSLVATACPDLESLDCTPRVLVLKGCSSLRQVRSNSQSRLLHLEDCPQLRSIGAAKVWCGSEKVTPSHQTIVLSGCAALRNLPSDLNVTGHMVLRGIGPIQRWPSTFHVGGELRIKDCPRIEELPPMEVQGCLKVEGTSGLRRLAQGTIVGRHLDLRACGHLEGVPRGVKVGGALYLPAHLLRQGAVLEVQDLPAEHCPVLRIPLLSA